MNNALDNILCDLDILDATVSELLDIEGFADKAKTMDMEQFLDLYQHDPVAFCEDMLDFFPDEHQQKILNSIRDNKRTTVRSGQGCGKTATVAGLILWYICTKEDAKIIATAPSMNQLFTVLWSELAKWLNGTYIEKFLTYTKTKLYMNGYEATWFAQPKTATTKEGMAGLHAENLLIICDEASGIKDDILETLQGTLSQDNNRLLFISNPTKNTGVYYDSFHANREAFNCIRINSEESIHVNRENIEMLAKGYGKDSNVYRIRVLGEFPKDEDDVFIPISLVEDAINTECDFLVKGRIDPSKINCVTIGADIARFGSDSTIIAPKINNTVLDLIEKRKQATTQTAGDIIVTCNDIRRKFSYDGHIVIIIDDTGVGGGVTDMLIENIKELNMPKVHVLPINFASSVKHKYYYDMTTAAWGYLRELLGFKADGTRGNSIIKLPNDNKLIAQLSTRKYSIHSGGKLQVMPKKEMKQKGLPSPDHADAVALSCYPINWQALEKNNQSNTGVI